MQTPAFDFHLIQPDGPIAKYIQAIWFASVSSSSSTITKPLFSDGACGVFFNLASPIFFKAQPCGQGAFWMPVKHHAEFIDLTPGCQLVGFRFHAGVPASVLRPLQAVFYQDHSLERHEHMQTDGYPLPLSDIFQQLLGCAQQGQETLFAKLQHWLAENIEADVCANSQVTEAVSVIDPLIEIQELNTITNLSLRQLERRFKAQVGMTPKYYQRLMRIRAAIAAIRQNPMVSLADLAVESGYSDQAHMTREFRQLAKMTPKQYQKTKTD